MALLQGSINTAGKVIISGNAPSPADQDGIWVRTVGGYLEGFYTYIGGWFRPHPIPASSQVRTMFAGAESAVWSFDGGDGTNPTVTPPTSTTGAMWQVDHTFDFKFPVGPGLNAVAYDGNAASTIVQGGVVTSAGNAGEERHVEVAAEVGPHVHNQFQGRFQHGTADTNAFQAGANSDGQVAANTVSGGGNPASGTPPVTALSANNMPPFVGIFFCMRTVRQFITAT